MDAIVMAAGEGTRLRPLTERWPKPVLPIDGRPVLATLLRELSAAGCPRATIVVGHLRRQVEALAGDGSGFGVEVGYAAQPQVLEAVAQRQGQGILGSSPRRFSFASSRRSFMSAILCEMA